MKSELEQIPGIGKNMARHLMNAGYPTIASLKRQDPEEISFPCAMFKTTGFRRSAFSD
jgi:predicted flap endonuclease-1-like 5' DNA nuclease